VRSGILSLASDLRGLLDTRTATGADPTPGRMMRTATAAVLAVALLLTGCTSQSRPTPDDTSTHQTPEAPTMTLEESKQQLLDIFDAAVAAAGGEWDLKTDRAPNPCEMSPTEGKAYDLAGFGPGSSDPAATASDVEAVWSDHELIRREVDGALEVLHPRDDQGLYFSFIVSENATTLLGTSVCASLP
jgi:hypothetical protein